ncbi:hypothetical protein Q604_UNBC00710G0001, partial [human gut metagenome]
MSGKAGAQPVSGADREDDDEDDDGE